MPDPAPLVIMRGNSGAGKSTVARRLRERVGPELIWIEQDYVRRVIMHEHDRPGADNIELLELITRYGVDSGRPVLLEGILYTEHYAEMLLRLQHRYPGQVHAFYLDVPLVETLRRHHSRDSSPGVTAADLERWYNPGDLVMGLAEVVVGAESGSEQTVGLIMRTARLPEGKTEPGRLCVRPAAGTSSAASERG